MTHYGKNLDALNDCLSDVAAGDYGPALGATGFVLGLRHYDKFGAAQDGTAHAVLDIFQSGNSSAAAMSRWRSACTRTPLIADRSIADVAGARRAWLVTRGSGRRVGAWPSPTM
ncbi:barstar family protein [Amycolatopsis sp. DSM 110486]|uniref:barstar family protein n=1 Tax=Amycolatopsis sp. DSM 110486 TaxID=2865832 RepID=UPI001C69A088|nr:barstar family protein [Amycolatopsis sp. DSM 110486]